MCKNKDKLQSHVEMIKSGGEEKNNNFFLVTLMSLGSVQFVYINNEFRFFVCSKFHITLWLQNQYHSVILQNNTELELIYLLKLL